MNPDYERELEAEIEHELKRLHSLHAPATLAARVMRVIEQRAASPWYRQSWQGWPRPIQALAMVILLAAFAGICFAGWKISHTEAFAAAVHKVGGLFVGLSVLFKTLGTLADTVVIVAKHLGTGFILGCIVAGLLGYAMCLGLGTLYVRVGWRASQETNL